MYTLYYIHMFHAERGKTNRLNKRRQSTTSIEPFLIPIVSGNPSRLYQLHQCRLQDNLMHVIYMSLQICSFLKIHAADACKIGLSRF